MRLLALLTVTLLVPAAGVLLSCGNGACEPRKGETWQNCVADCCKTHDCDCQDNDCNHKKAPETPGHGHIHNRREKVYRYHGDI
jgi:hypothetical protein